MASQARPGHQFVVRSMHGPFGRGVLIHMDCILLYFDESMFQDQLVGFTCYYKGWSRERATCLRISTVVW